MSVSDIAEVYVGATLSILTFAAVTYILFQAAVGRARKQLDRERARLRSTSPPQR